MDGRGTVRRRAALAAPGGWAKRGRASPHVCAPRLACPPSSAHLFQWFLMALSVRPSNSLAMRAHLLPWTTWACQAGGGEGGGGCRAVKKRWRGSARRKKPTNDPACNLPPVRTAASFLSSSSVQLSRVMSGLRWLCHLMLAWVGSKKAARLSQADQRGRPNGGQHPLDRRPPPRTARGTASRCGPAAPGR